ncbi:MAG: hypothetical protein NC301_07000 [Bacteroides sp.]|nr:hypothetical protein [Bacteroides sp.]MCM1379946.1 hypothetical protein [Bacteroides sp.]MCM1446199.1 hypothetical protein [Prevotella sp.]
MTGNIKGQPWWRIYGLNASKAPNTSYTVSVDSPSELAAKLAEAEPYKVIKVKMGVVGDREMIETIGTQTDRPICVDVNQGWKTKEEAFSCAVSAASQLAPLADWVDLDGNLLIANDPYVGMQIVDGKVTLSGLPGIGVLKK